MLKRTYLYLIIYILLLQGVFSQNLQLKIKGENTEETTIIDSIGYLKSHSDFKSVYNEIDSLQTKLYYMGYLQSQILNTQKVNDSTITSVFDLKNKTSIIHVYYEQGQISKSVLELISKSVNNNFFILPINQTENALNIINNEISKKGFPFNSLKLSKIRKNLNNTLEAYLIISKNNNVRRTNQIIIKGYEKFPKSFLKHYLKIKEGSTFNLEAIKTKIKQIDNLLFASQIKPPEILFTKDSTSLYLYLEKKTSNSFDGFLGFGTNEDTNKIIFDGYLNLNLTNNLNYGESLNLIYKSDENDQKTLNVDASLPYLFKSPLGAELSLNIFKQDSSFTTTNQNVKLFYQINPKNTIASGIKSIQSDDLLNNNASGLIQDYKTNFYTVSYKYLNRQNNRLFSTNSLLEFEIGFGNRDLNNMQERQYDFKLNTFKIFNLNRRNSFYFRLNGASLVSNTYLENELYRFGGINSIRGFKENTILSTLFGVLNTEYRFLLDQNIYIHSIVDASYFENKNLNLKEKLFGFGFGFGILTKSGLLRFIYANGKRESDQFKLSNSKIHLSISSRF